MGSRNDFSWYGAASVGSDAAYAPLEEVSRPRRARRIAVAAAAGALAALAIVVLCAREHGESGRSFGEVLAQTILGGGGDGATQWPQGSSLSRVKFLSEIQVCTFLFAAATSLSSPSSSSPSSSPRPSSATPHPSDHQRNPSPPLIHFPLRFACLMITRHAYQTHACITTRVRILNPPRPHKRTRQDCVIDSNNTSSNL